jgi:hypothetical protein
MTSELNTIKNGVKLVDMLGIVHWFESIEGTLAAHVPVLVLNRA